MVRLVLHAAAISVYTLVFGSLAIILSPIVPNGAPLFWFGRPWARLISWTCRVRVRTSGLEKIPGEGPCIFMSNHQSHFDVVALLQALPGPYAILAKRELFYIPVFGWALWLAGMVPVDRARRSSAIRSIDRAADKVRRGKRVLVFAEGTRSEDGRLQPFKKGGFHMALKSEAPIVPICVKGGRQVLPKRSHRIRPGVMEVVIGEPVRIKGGEVRTVERLMHDVRTAMEIEMAGPETWRKPQSSVAS